MTTNLTKKFSTSTLEGQENFTIIIWEVFIRSDFLKLYESSIKEGKRNRSWQRYKKQKFASQIWIFLA
jgi:hypothetical protein